jgi:hypothetical protein
MQTLTPCSTCLNTNVGLTIPVVKCIRRFRVKRNGKRTLPYTIWKRSGKKPR